jgi:hypothetical protein
MTLKDKLDSIRKALDADVIDVDIEALVNKGKALAQLIGLSAECKSIAKKNLEKSRVSAVASLATRKLPPSVLLKLAEAECAEQIADYEYADRLNAGITHQLDFYRSVISLHKTEVENSLK